MRSTASSASVKGAAGVRFFEMPRLDISSTVASFGPGVQALAHRVPALVVGADLQVINVDAAPGQAAATQETTPPPSPRTATAPMAEWVQRDRAAARSAAGSPTRFPSRRTARRLAILRT